ncbi:MAG: ribonuclease J [Bacilli bacterium]|nr:ribonuclease J [Bacilli bacterium]
MDRIKIFALGGLDEEGKNCTVVSINDDIFVISCGIQYPDRTMPGVDYVIPNYTYLLEHKDKVKAYLLTHGHDDEMGALAYIYEKVPAPIYGSKVTIEMFKIFARHVGKSDIPYDFRIIPPTVSFNVAGHKISYFQTAHNVALSSGVCLHTDQGNLVFTSDFVVENASDPNFLHDMNAMAKIAEEPTLCLFTESVYASRSGYTAPGYKLLPFVEDTLKESSGRIFIALYSTNYYNIDEIIKWSVASKKKIVPYDEESMDAIVGMQKAGQLTIPRENICSINEINRIREQDTIVLILGYGVKIFNKIGLLAEKQNENVKNVSLSEKDTFIIACTASDKNEIEAVSAIDDLYRSGPNIYQVPRRSFLKMHASEEDLKTIISIFHPKFYVPYKGLFKDLLANAQIALKMSIGLGHNNVFLLDKGLALNIVEGKVSLMDEKIPSDGIMIDGKGIGDVKPEILAQREKMSQGLVIMAATISKSTHQVVAGPDVQVRGLVFLKDSDFIIKEATKIFSSLLGEELVKKSPDIEFIRTECHEKVMRYIRRATGKEPQILPIIVEVA